jgi:hypothetical protein
MPSFNERHQNNHGAAILDFLVTENAFLREPSGVSGVFIKVNDVIRSFDIHKVPMSFGKAELLHK